MKLQKTIRYLTLYLVLMIVMSIILFVFLKNYAANNYSEEKKEQLLSSTSKFRYHTNNPCAYFINGDPSDVGDDYIKLTLHCDKTTASKNTLNLKALKDQTFAGAISLLGNIHGFDTKISSSRVESLGNLVTSGDLSWHCFVNYNSEITNFQDPVNKQQSIDCFYNFSPEDTKAYYDNN